MPSSINLHICQSYATQMISLRYVPAAFHAANQPTKWLYATRLINLSTSGMLHGLTDLDIFAMEIDQPTYLPGCIPRGQINLTISCMLCN